MSRFGVFLFILVLLFYGFVLSRAMISKLAPVKEGAESAGGFQKFMDRANQIFENKGVLFILFFSGVVIALWNFFAPDFGAPLMQGESGGATIVGALLPSVALMLDSFVLYPEIIEKVNLEEITKQKYYNFVDKIKDFMGIVTLVLAILHIAFFKSILF